MGTISSCFIQDSNNNLRPCNNNIRLCTNLHNSPFITFDLVVAYYSSLSVEDRIFLISALSYVQ